MLLTRQRSVMLARPRGWLAFPLLLGLVLPELALPLAAAAAGAGGPVISPIPDQRLPVNRSLALPFTVQTGGASPSGVVLHATSSRPGLVPDRHLRLTGIGSYRELILRPILDQTGSTRITLAARDGSGQVRERSFDLRVEPAAEPPGNPLVVTALVDAQAPALTLVWNGPANADGYTIHRRPAGQPDWGAPFADKLSRRQTSYTDTNIVPGAAFEYRITAGPPQSFHQPAYLLAGIDAPPVDHRGSLALVLDQTHTNQLAFELDRLRQDLVGDGWTVFSHAVSRSASPERVKDFLRDAHLRQPAPLRSVFLLGHVPIPRSGWLSPDSHHRRAFPADVFYADLDGDWPDEVVRADACVPPVRGQAQSRPQECSRPEARNYPHDGTYDPSTLPSDVELELGRVDLFNLPGFLPAGETDLLRQYLEKNHAYRHARLEVPQRALADGWASLFLPRKSVLVGPENVSVTSFLPTLARQPYLWAARAQFAAYHGFNDGLTTARFAEHHPQAVFFELFGSYFVEWDYWDAFLRAPLATAGYGLVSLYGARPLWLVHPLALGATIGSCARETQNQPDRGYQTDVASRGVHIALLGDPTLRLHPVCPPRHLFPRAQGAGVRLAWHESREAVEGYHVYRADTPGGPFTRLTDGWIRGTMFDDPTPPTGPLVYMVRALKLQLSPAGTYYNLSQGVTCRLIHDLTPDRFAPTVTIDQPSPGPALAAPVCIVASVVDDRDIARVEFRVGDTLFATRTRPPYRAVWEPEGEVAGPTLFQVIGFDSSGNSASNALLINVSTDTRPPRLMIDQPADGETVWGHVIVRARVYDDAAVDRVELWVDGVRYAVRDQPPFNFVWHTFDPAGVHDPGSGAPAVPDGLHRLIVKAFDRAGNRAEQAFAVIVDGALGLPMLLPANLAAESAEQGAVLALTLNWRGGPTRRHQGVFLHLVNERTGEEFGIDSHHPPVPTHYWSGTQSYTVPLKLNPAIPPGDYRLLAGLYANATRGTFTAGPGIQIDRQRRGRIGSLRITPDITPPDIIDSTLIHGQPVGGELQVEIRVRDLDRVERLEFTVGGRVLASRSAGELVALDYGIWRGTFAWDTTELAPGPHDVQFTAYDPSGNRRQATVTVRVANPTLLPADIAPARVVPGGQLQIRYHWSGGPLTKPATVITFLLAPSGTPSKFSFAHVPQPPMPEWTGEPVEYEQRKIVPPDLPPGRYRVAVAVAYPNGAMIPVHAGPGVERLRLGGHVVHIIGAVTVTDAN